MPSPSADHIDARLYPGQMHHKNRAFGSLNAPLTVVTLAATMGCTSLGPCPPAGHRSARAAGMAGTEERRAAPRPSTSRPKTPDLPSVAGVDARATSERTTERTTSG